MAWPCSGTPYTPARQARTAIGSTTLPPPPSQLGLTESCLSTPSSILTSTSTSSPLVSLPPELLIMIAGQLTTTSSTTTPTLTFCTTCSLPYIFDVGKMSLVALGLSHPYLWKLLKGEKNFEWLYRSCKWLSQRQMLAARVSHVTESANRGQAMHCAFEPSSLGTPSRRHDKTAQKIAPKAKCECHPGYHWQGDWPTLDVDVEEVLENEYGNPRSQLAMLTTDRWIIWRSLLS